MKKNKVALVARAALIAALYVVLTTAFSAFSFDVIQVRVSEALSFLPFFNGSAVWGLTIGCFISNTLARGVPLDIVFGTLATFIGAFVAWIIGKLAKNSKHQVLFAILATLPNVVANTLIVPQVLKIAYGAEESIPFMMLTVGIGEIFASTILGTLVILAFRKNFKMFK